MAGGRNRRGQATAFSQTAGEKNAFNISRTNQARSAGELLAEPFGTAFYHLGSSRFGQGTNLPITRGNPAGFLDLEHRTGAELARGLHGGQNLGTGVFLTAVQASQEAAAIIFEQLGRSDPAKQKAFRDAVLAPGSQTDRLLFGHDGRGLLSRDFIFSGTKTNPLPPIQNSVARGARDRKGVADPNVADSEQAGIKRTNLGRRRGGTLLTGNAGLSGTSGTKKTLLG